MKVIQSGEWEAMNFVIVLDDSLECGPTPIADRILDALRTPFAINASIEPLTITASVGITTGTYITPEDLLRDADIALYRAKGEGKDCAAVFSLSMQESVETRRNLELELRHAIVKQQFFVEFQPIVGLTSGVVTGVEALVRWQHPLRGVVGPSEFILLLESSGLIKQVGSWVLDVACRQGAMWASQGHPLTMAVNLFVCTTGR